MFLVSMETPVGSSFEYTDGKFKAAEDWLMKEPILDRYYSAVGGFDGGSVNSGMLFVTLKDLKEGGVLDAKQGAADVPGRDHGQRRATALNEASLP